MRKKNAISAAQAAVIVVILLVAIGAAVYFYSTSAPAASTSTTPTITTTPTTISTSPSTTTTTSTNPTTSSTTTTTTTSTGPTSTSGPSPSVLTYEETETVQYLDPSVEYFSWDSNVIQNVYEPLLWYNGTSSTQVIPWLAKSYIGSADGKTFNFTLRSGITFADGTALNATDVYFSFNRVLVGDSSTPTHHGSQGTWILQQLLNTSLSTTLCCGQKYGSKYADAVLAQNFITVTGPLTFTFHLMHPNAAFGVILANSWGFIMDPKPVMQQDLALWTQASKGYKLPFPTPSGNMMAQFKQYLEDFSSTCDAGATPSGCGTTYLDGSYQGATVGTGPYTVKSFDETTNNIVLVSNPTYWGGPYQSSGGQKITPRIGTIKINYVPDQSTRTLDLQNAAKSGQAMTIDLVTDHLYDFADRNTWLNQHKLVSVIPGISIYGTYPQFSTLFDPFDTNVSNPLTGTYQKFQPFADLRLRLAFADAVNISQINHSVGNDVQTVATMVNPPGLPPAGSYNANIKPRYSYNLTAASNLLVDAMQNPLAKFNFANGTKAKAGFFDNTFGCKTLNANKQCDSPVPQTVNLIFGTGDTLDEAFFNQIASNINTISFTYNMGLTVNVQPLPTGQLLTEAFSTPSRLAFYALGWIDDYPWVVDFLGPMFAANQAYTGSGGWNIGSLNALYQQAVTATSNNNLTGLVKVSDAMNKIANNMVMYLWTVYSANLITMTSNVQGFYYNPSLYTAAGGGVGPEYFATLY